eukprot:1756915-Pleurochrysis_carterae.AAC.1
MQRLEAWPDHPSAEARGERVRLAARQNLPARSRPSRLERRTHTAAALTHKARPSASERPAHSRSAHEALTPSKSGAKCRNARLHIGGYRDRQRRRHGAHRVKRARLCALHCQPVAL